MVCTGQVSAAGATGWLGDHAVLGTVLLRVPRCSTWRCGRAGRWTAARRGTDGRGAAGRAARRGGAAARRRERAGAGDRAAVRRDVRPTAGDGGEGREPSWTRHATGVLGAADGPLPEGRAYGRPRVRPRSTPATCTRGWRSTASTTGPRSVGWCGPGAGRTRCSPSWPCPRRPDRSPRARCTRAAGRGQHAAQLLDTSDEPGRVPFSWSGVRGGDRAVARARVRMAARPEAPDTVELLVWDEHGRPYSAWTR
ncbi:hypothetical protein OEIGOIKO_08201 [Streptomyces chrestomyceticus JCM 4735]|uniref:Uncharacterized protein n=1 Tax=Streptomyces chrestomyceticus JCM 4735 TaxID=1306181 RepID=A0A7U9L667_9ACTN|nr:hypothetical protein OEIGOIKO_08201 [Streptomyces chrestomyceticus JCM 4735]